MLTILHISDCHAQTETVRRLERLAHESPDCDVVAHTGDCLSTSCWCVRREWDDWPQRYKFAVPGNHFDHSVAFLLLKNWEWRTPWLVNIQDATFVGLGLASERTSEGYFGKLVAPPGSRLIVLMSHQRLSVEDLEGSLSPLVDGRELLVLHGDEHPRGFDGCAWDDAGQVRGRRFFRSNVCSSAQPRGRGHQIVWAGGTLRRFIVQGELLGN
jgi:hypothetical protein